MNQILRILSILMLLFYLLGNDVYKGLSPDTRLFAALGSIAVFIMVAWRAFDFMNDNMQVVFWVILLAQFFVIGRDFEQSSRAYFLKLIVRGSEWLLMLALIYLAW
jgi:hypothetical protein